VPHNRVWTGRNDHLRAIALHTYGWRQERVLAKRSDQADERSEQKKRTGDPQHEWHVRPAEALGVNAHQREPTDEQREHAAHQDLVPHLLIAPSRLKSLLQKRVIVPSEPGYERCDDAKNSVRRDSSNPTPLSATSRSVPARSTFQTHADPGGVRVVHDIVQRLASMLVPRVNAGEQAVAHPEEAATRV
jgi:hypothetical protein